MTQDEIIEMARQADFEIENGMFDSKIVCVDGVNITKGLETFAKLVAAKEREACFAGEILNSANIMANDMPHTVIEKYRATIRARGQT